MAEPHEAGGKVGRLRPEDPLEVRWKSGMRRRLLNDHGFAEDTVDGVVDHLWAEANRIADECLPPAAHPTGDDWTGDPAKHHPRPVLDNQYVAREDAGMTSNATATAASAYAPITEHLDHLVRVYGPDFYYQGDMVSIIAAAREHAYLTAIAEVLADPATGPVLETVMDTASHTYIPMLLFPAFDDHDNGFSVWAEWEGGGHEMNIVPETADEFPLLPDGRTPGDHIKAAAMIRDYARAKGLI